MTGNKYQPLTDFLAKEGRRKLCLKFSTIERRILGVDLPARALEQAEWWTNEATGPRSPANAWLTASWKVAEVDLEGRKVYFERAGEHPKRRRRRKGRKTDPAPKDGPERAPAPTPTEVDRSRSRQPRRRTRDEGRREPRKELTEPHAGTASMPPGKSGIIVYAQQLEDSSALKCGHCERELTDFTIVYRGPTEYRCCKRCGAMNLQPGQ
ncbi:MAG: hypothetical protein QF415_10500 [Candidatus Undinarchaeales archaeon]|nr:hypothetical protein [Candidatus Undinarchaeales archaeon]MDP7493214.1 hypothetical protein [Candidatus Undinarchaeales archaeon]